MMGKTIYLPSDRGPAAPARAPRLRLGDRQCSLPVARLPGSQAASGLVHAAVAGQEVLPVPSATERAITVAALTGRLVASGSLAAEPPSRWQCDLVRSRRPRPASTSTNLK